MLGPLFFLVYTDSVTRSVHHNKVIMYADIFKASQPRGRATGSRAYERHEMQGV